MWLEANGGDLEEWRLRRSTVLEEAKEAAKEVAKTAEMVIMATNGPPGMKRK